MTKSEISLEILSTKFRRQERNFERVKTIALRKLAEISFKFRSFRNFALFRNFRRVVFVEFRRISLS